jgi:ribosome-associated protein
MEPLELAKAIAKVMDSKKAKDIKILKVEALTVLADYFVVASGSSTTQVGALNDEVDFRIGQRGIRPLRVEGAATRSWILLDYGAVVVHIFYPEARDFYALERLWADAQPADTSFLETVD